MLCNVSHKYHEYHRMLTLYTAILQLTTTKQTNSTNENFVSKWPTKPNGLIKTNHDSMLSYTLLIHIVLVQFKL